MPGPPDFVRVISRRLKNPNLLPGLQINNGTISESEPGGDPDLDLYPGLVPFNGTDAEIVLADTDPEEGAEIEFPIPIGAEEIEQDGELFSTVEPISSVSISTGTDNPINVNLNNSRRGGKNIDFPLVDDEVPGTADGIVRLNAKLAIQYNF